VRDGMGSAPLDVDIVKLRPEHAGPWNVFDLTRQLRAALGSPKHPFDPRDATPNHVLIPARGSPGVGRNPSDSHGCPWGPPSPTARGTLPGPENVPLQHVVVIDSGFQWELTWGANPLAAHFPTIVQPAQ